MKDKNINLFSINIFLDKQVLSGLIIIVCVVTALVLANSPLSSLYFNFFNTDISFYIGRNIVSKSIKLWINDGLMAFFFLLIGFEIKRELIAGELSDFKKAVYPVIAALGGMIFPIIIFLAFNFNRPTIRGWGIPMSTDIAFTLGIMLLLGGRISKSLKVSVTALAIIDDIGALIIIAIFYSAGLSPAYLIGIIILTAVILVLNKLNIRFGLIYFTAGVIIWSLFMLSGIHPAIAGVLTALLIPSNTKINFEDFKKRIGGLVDKISGGFLNKEKHFEFADDISKKTFHEMENLIHKVEPPLQHYEQLLKPYVNFIIVPFFALANSGIVLGNLRFTDLFSPLSLGIIFGLAAGKSTGIYLFSLLSFKSRIAAIPANTGMDKIYGAGWLAGIGFTMSLFIAELSFTDHYLLDLSKASIFIGSIISAVTGVLIILMQKKKEKPA